MVLTVWLFCQRSWSALRWFDRLRDREHRVFYYLQIPYIAGAGELAVFCGALIGAGLGFSGLARTRHKYSWEMSVRWPWAQPLAFGHYYPP